MDPEVAAARYAYEKYKEETTEEGYIAMVIEEQEEQSAREEAEFFMGMRERKYYLISRGRSRIEVE